MKSVSGSGKRPSESCRRGNCSGVRPYSSVMIRCALRGPSPPPPMMKTASMASGIWSWIEAVSMMISLYEPALLPAWWRSIVPIWPGGHEHSQECSSVQSSRHGPFPPIVPPSPG